MGAAANRHTPIVLAEAIVQLLEAAQATSDQSRAALEIARAVIQGEVSFTLRDDAASDAEHAIREAARDAATASSLPLPQQP